MSKLQIIYTLIYMQISYLGHSTLLIESNDKKILVDPFITANPLAKNVSVSNLKPDYIIVTHAHQDHILDVEEIAKSSNATIISNFEIVNYFEKLGCKGHPMNTGGSWKFDFGKLISTLAHHSSSFLDGSYGGNPNGYIIESNGKKIYIAGDTCLFYDMKLIAEQYGTFDLIVLPIGDNFTMGINDALRASDFLQCNTILGYHFDTFGFIKINHQQAKNLFNKNNKELILLPIAESITL